MSTFIRWDVHWLCRFKEFEVLEGEHNEERKKKRKVEIERINTKCRDSTDALGESAVESHICK